MISSPSELKTEDCRRDDINEVTIDSFCRLSLNSSRLVYSPPSIRIVRGSAGLPNTVPLYRESSSVVLCFFLRTILG
jgi:hypothetical protein